jgi:hypothetical protein
LHRLHGFSHPPRRIAAGEVSPKADRDIIATEVTEDTEIFFRHGFTQMDTVLWSAWVYFGRAFLDVNVCESPACVHRVPEKRAPFVKPTKVPCSKTTKRKADCAEGENTNEFDGKNVPRDNISNISLIG